MTTRQSYATTSAPAGDDSAPRLHPVHVTGAAAWPQPATPAPAPVTILEDPATHTRTYDWTQSQIDTMVRSVGYLIDRIPPGHAQRYDVATLAVTLGLLPAGVPLLRIALEHMADVGTIARDRWADIGEDRTYILGGGGTVQPMRDMDFGQALAAMKQGKRCARRGWVIDGKWVTLRTGYPDGIAVNDNTAESFGVQPGTVVVFQPYFQMCEKDGSIRTWNKGDQDLIAEDWYLVDGPGNLAQ